MKNKSWLLTAFMVGVGLFSAVIVGAAYGRNLDEVNAVDGGDLELTLLNHIGGGVWGMDQAGDYAYISVGSRMAVVDVTDPSLPVLVGKTEVLSGMPSFIRVSGTHAYGVVEGDIVVVDVSDPASPVAVMTYQTAEDVTRLVISGTLAYVAEEDSNGEQGGLHILDISNPASPAEVSFLGPIGDAFDVALWGNYAYIAGRFSGSIQIKVVDVSDPANPTVVSSRLIFGPLDGLATDGSYLYAAGGGEGLYIFDSSDPNNLVYVGGLNTDGDSRSVDVNGNMVYVSASTEGINYIDVTDPTSPTLVGNFHFPIFSADTAVVYRNGQVYGTNQLSGLRILEPDSPVETGVYQEALNSPQNTMRHENLLFSQDEDFGLKIMDISDGVNPVVVGSYETIFSYVDVAVSGDLAYFVGNIFSVLDISDPTLPSEVGYYFNGMTFNAVEVSGNYAFLNHQTSGLWVLDISNPMTPTAVINYNLPNNTWDMAMVGDYIYLANSLNDLIVLDVSNPHMPGPAVNVPITGEVQQVQVEGDYAYVTAEESGLHILDISDPGNPTEVQSYPLDWLQYNELVASEGYVYISGRGNDLNQYSFIVIDVRNPLNPELFGSYNLPPYTYANPHSVKGGEIFLPMRERGMFILRGPAAIAAENDSPTVWGQTTTFTATMFVSDTFSFAWDFGDGNNGSGQIAAHTYEQVGEYTAVVVATGISGTYTATTSVTVDEVIAGLTASNDGPTEVGNPTTLMASITAGTDVSYAWDFGDGNTGSGAVVLHTYASEGVYTAVVTATNMVSMETATTMVTVDVSEFMVFMPVVIGN